MRHLLEAIAALRALDEATLSANVNPPVFDIQSVPTPGNDSGYRRHKPSPKFNVNLGHDAHDRAEQERRHHMLVAHQGCPPGSPACRDREWETPTWVGGAEWAIKPKFMPGASDPQNVMSKDEIAGWLKAAGQLKSVTETTSGALAQTPAPVGLISRSGPSSGEKPGVVSRVSSWLKSLSGSTPATPEPVAKVGDKTLSRRKLKTLEPRDTGPKIPWSTKPTKDPIEKTKRLIQMAQGIRANGKQVYVVQRGGWRWITDSPRPERGEHVIFPSTALAASLDRTANLAEMIAVFRALSEAAGPGAGLTIAGGAAPKHATTSANAGSRTSDTGRPFFGHHALAHIERERQHRERKQKTHAYKCGVGDPACRDKEWEVQIPVGGVNLMHLAGSGQG